MRKRRLNKVGFNSKLIVDVMLASVIVQKAPDLVNMIFPIDQSLRTVAGVGVGYLAGSMLKKPDLANAAIALGAVDFVTPFLDSLIGGGSAPIMPASSSVMVPVKEGAPMVTETAGLENYFSLNGYINNPGTRQNYSDYAQNYDY